MRRLTFLLVSALLATAAWAQDPAAAEAAMKAQQWEKAASENQPSVTGKVSLTSTLFVVSFSGERRLRVALAVPALAILLASLGCGSVKGSGAATSSNTVGTPAGSYTLAITGTSGSQSHSATVTAVVN